MPEQDRIYYEKVIADKEAEEALMKKQESENKKEEDGFEDCECDAEEEVKEPCCEDCGSTKNLKSQNVSMAGVEYWCEDCWEKEEEDEEEA